MIQTLSLAVIVVIAVVIIAVAMSMRREKMTVMPGVPALPSDLDVLNNPYDPQYYKYRAYLRRARPYCGCDQASLAQPARYVFHTTARGRGY